MKYHLIKFDFSSGDCIYIFKDKYYFFSFPYEEEEEISKSELEFIPFSDENAFFDDIDGIIKYAEEMYVKDKYINPKLKHTKILLRKIEEKEKNLQQRKDFVELKNIIIVSNDLSSKKVRQEVRKRESEQSISFQKVYLEKYSDNLAGVGDSDYALQKESIYETEKELTLRNES